MSKTNVIDLKAKERGEKQGFMLFNSISPLDNPSDKTFSNRVDRIERSILFLIRNNLEVNFCSVARTADISKNWLYSKPKIRARIEYLRSQYGKVSHLKSKNKGCSNALIEVFESEYMQLLKDNTFLKSQLECTRSQSNSIATMQQKIVNLEAANEKLKIDYLAAIKREKNSQDNINSILTKLNKFLDLKSEMVNSEAELINLGGLEVKKVIEALKS